MTAGLQVEGLGHGRSVWMVAGASRGDNPGSRFAITSLLRDCKPDSEPGLAANLRVPSSRPVAARSCRWTHPNSAPPSRRSSRTPERIGRLLAPSRPRSRPRGWATEQDRADVRGVAGGARRSGYHRRRRSGLIDVEACVADPRCNRCCRGPVLSSWTAEPSAAGDERLVAAGPDERCGPGSGLADLPIRSIRDWRASRTSRLRAGAAARRNRPLGRP
jgi:hypothetical protein